MRTAPQPDQTRAAPVEGIGSPLRFLTVVWLLTALVLVAAMIGAIDSSRRFDHTAHQASEIERIRGEILRLDEVLTMSARMSAASGDAIWEERYRRCEPEVDAAIRKANELVPGMESSGKTDAANAALVEMENRSFGLVREGRSREAQELLSSSTYATQKKLYAEGMQEVDRQLGAAVDKAMRRQRTRTDALLFAGSVAIVLLLCAWAVVIRMIRRWRAALAQKHERLLDELAWRTVAEEELRQHRDELELLVERRTAELRQANENMRRDLEAGAEYVRGLLAAPVRDRVCIDWRYVPSSSLGGDTIGHHWIDSDHLALFLIDVTGHGLDAALFSVTMMNVIRSGLLGNADPRQPDAVLASLNDSFQGEQHGGKYFTIWYGVYRVSTRTLNWSGGGHHPAMLYQPSRAEPVHLSSQGLMMGIFPAEEFKVESCQIEPDARLFVFSDGAFEIIRNQKMVWSLGELTTYVSGLVGRKSEVLDHLLVHVKELHGSSQLDDDFTILEAGFP